MPKSVVSIVKGTDAEKMVEEALSHLGGVDSLIKPGSVVVVKPNATINYPPERCITTSPAFIGAVVKVLRKARPKEIIMAESSAMGRDSLECLEVSGQKKLPKRYCCSVPPPVLAQAVGSASLRSCVSGLTGNTCWSWLHFTVLSPC